MDNKLLAIEIHKNQDTQSNNYPNIIRIDLTKDINTILTKLNQCANIVGYKDKIIDLSKKYGISIKISQRQHIDTSTSNTYNIINDINLLTIAYSNKKYHKVYINYMLNDKEESIEIEDLLNITKMTTEVKNQKIRKVYTLTQFSNVYLFNFEIDTPLKSYEELPNKMNIAFLVG